MRFPRSLDVSLRPVMRLRARALSVAIVLAGAVAFAALGPGVPTAAAATPTATDLGTLGGTGSHAIAISGHIVVGNSDTASGASHAFAYDLAATSPHR